MSSIVAGDKKINTTGTTESSSIYQTGYLNGIIENIFDCPNFSSHFCPQYQCINFTTTPTTIYEYTNYC